MSDWKSRAVAVDPTEFTDADLEAMKQAELEKRIAKRPVGEGSFGTGVKQGVTLGFGDELAGAAGALGALAGGVSDKMSGFDSGGASLGDLAKEAYTGARDAERKRLEESRQADPLLTGAGQIASSLLLPGLGAAGSGGGLGAAALQGAKVGAATGAASGVGEAESLDAADVAPKVLGGAAVGGIAGAAAPLIGGILRPAAKAIQKPLAEAGSRADELRVLTTAGATGGAINAPRVLQEAERVPGGVKEMARVLRESGVSRGVTTTSGVLKRATEAQAKSGGDIGRLISEATNAGGKVDVGRLTASLRQQAAEATAGMSGVSDVARQQAANLLRLADRIEGAAPGGFAALEDIKALSTQLGADAGEAYLARAMGRPVTGKAEALMATRRGAEGAIDEGMEAAGRSSQPYRDARRLNQVSRIASEAAETSLGRANKNNLLGLTDAALLAGGAPGAALAAGRKALTPVSAGLRATGAEAADTAAKGLQRMLDAPPSGALGRTGGALYGASVGAMEEPVSTGAGGFNSEDQALATDLLSRGMSPEEVASILGPPQSTTQTSMNRPVLRARPSAAR